MIFRGLFARSLLSLIFTEDLPEFDLAEAWPFSQATVSVSRQSAVAERAFLAGNLPHSLLAKSVLLEPLLGLFPLLVTSGNLTGLQS
jgi:hypothetical protein